MPCTTAIPDTISVLQTQFFNPNFRSGCISFFIFGVRLFFIFRVHFIFYFWGAFIFYIWGAFIFCIWGAFIFCIWGAFIFYIWGAFIFLYLGCVYFHRGVVPYGWGLANILVFQKVRHALGFDRCKFCMTAAAPIMKDTLDFFMSLNLPLMEIYGMSESSGTNNIL